MYRRLRNSSNIKVLEIPQQTGYESNVKQTECTAPCYEAIFSRTARAQLLKTTVAQSVPHLAHFLKLTPVVVMPPANSQNLIHQDARAFTCLFVPSFKHSENLGH